MNPGPPSYVRRVWPIPVAVVGGLGVLLLDLKTPAGMAIPLLYVGTVLVGFLSEDGRVPFALACVATVLSAIGYLVSPGSDTAGTVALVNHALGLGAVWAVTLAGLRQRRLSRAATVTERLRQEIAERTEAERRLDLLFESSPEAIALVTGEGRIERINKEFTRLFGWAPQEAVDRLIDELIVPEELRAEGAGLTDRSRRGERLVVETVRCRKDGSRIHVSVLGAPFAFGQGELRVYAIYRDITDRKRAEEALRESETAYRQLFERAPYGILRVGADGTIERANPALLRMLGVDAPEELSEMPNVTELFEDRDEGVRLMERCHASDGLSAVETRWRSADGRALVVRLSARCVVDAERQIAGCEVFVEDVTAQRLLEEQLRQAQKMEAIGELTGGIAHDFNNLLTIVVAGTDVLASRLPRDDAAGREALEEVRRAARRGAELVRSLLAFARRDMLAAVPEDLGQLVQRMYEMLRRLIPETVQLAVTATAEPSVARVDRGAFQQIIVNLINNARDAMPDGGRITIAVQRTVLDAEGCRSRGWGEPGQYVEISVTDTGVGMPREMLGRVFEPFFTTKPPGVGTGLGLSMVYGLVKQHDGFIDIESAVGVGTSVRILFPLVGGEVTTAPEPRRPAPAGHRGECVLVVEDEPTIRRVARRALEHEGYRVLVAEDGVQALELLRDRGSEVHLVLSDIVMPRMGGGQLHREAAKLGYAGRFLFMTGYPARDARSSGAFDPSVPLLAKPWAIEELLRSVRDVLDGSERLATR